MKRRGVAVRGWIFLLTGATDLIPSSTDETASPFPCRDAPRLPAAGCPRAGRRGPGCRGGCPAEGAGLFQHRLLPASRDPENQPLAGPARSFKRLRGRCDRALEGPPAGGAGPVRRAAAEQCQRAGPGAAGGAAEGGGGVVRHRQEGHRGTPRGAGPPDEMAMDEPAGRLRFQQRFGFHQGEGDGRSGREGSPRGEGPAGRIRDRGGLDQPRPLRDRAAGIPSAAAGG